MIEIRKLKYGYSKKKLIYEELSFDLSAGSITGLLGKNGAGKTTLLKLITGLSYPLSGGITINGNHSNKRNPAVLGDIYFVPEEFNLPGISIKDYINSNHVFYPRFSLDKMAQIMLEFGLDENFKLTKISHGQRKKFLISFALATQCRLLVLDEPTNGLDIPSKVLFRKILAGSLDEDQLVIISTHQVKDVENLIDTILILENGQMVFKENTENISDQLSFETDTNGEGDGILYSEPIPGGYKVIRRQNGSSSKIDIELLFNATIAGKKLMTHDKAE